MTRAAPDDVATLYLQYGASVVRRATQILRDRDEAQEMLQDVFARLVARPELMRRARDPSTFLYTVTTNACLNRLRNRRNRAQLVERELRPWQRDVAPGSGEDRAVVLDLLVKLPEDQASVVIYCYLDGMSHHEIAEVLGCSRRHVGDLIERVHARAHRRAHRRSRELPARSRRVPVSSCPVLSCSRHADADGAVGRGRAACVRELHPM